MTIQTVIKIGGSMSVGQNSPSALMQALVDLAARHGLLIVPGGGRFAEEVRQAFDRFRLSEGVAHRMALMAMDQYGLLLTGLIPGATAVTALANARAVAGAGGLPVILPYLALWTADPLENSWRTTGDAIAAWLAGLVGARLLVLVKAAKNLPPAATAAELADLGLVDPIFAAVLRTPCRLISGYDPRQLQRLITEDDAIGTEVLQ